MTSRATTRWRRDVFVRDLAHLPDPESAPLTTRGGRRQQALCPRHVRLDEPADEDTLRCPDCERLDGEQDEDDVPGGAAGPPAASV